MKNYEQRLITCREQAIDFFDYFFQNKSPEYLKDLMQAPYLRAINYCAEKWPLEFAGFLVKIYDQYSNDPDVSDWFKFVLHKRYNDKSIVDLLAVNTQILDILKTLCTNQEDVWNAFFVELEIKIAVQHSDSSEFVIPAEEFLEDIELQRAHLLSIASDNLLKEEAELQRALLLSTQPTEDIELQSTPTSVSNYTFSFFDTSDARLIIKNAVKGQNHVHELFQGIIHKPYLFLRLLNEREYSSTILETAKLYPVTFISYLYAILNEDRYSKSYDFFYQCFSGESGKALFNCLKDQEVFRELEHLINEFGPPYGELPSNKLLLKIIQTIFPELIKTIFAMNPGP